MIFSDKECKKMWKECRDGFSYKSKTKKSGSGLTDPDDNNDDDSFYSEHMNW